MLCFLFADDQIVLVQDEKDKEYMLKKPRIVQKVEPKDSFPQNGVHVHRKENANHENDTVICLGATISLDTTFEKNKSLKLALGKMGKKPALSVMDRHPQLKY